MKIETKPHSETEDFPRAYQSDKNDVVFIVTSPLRYIAIRGGSMSRYESTTAVDSIVESCIPLSEVKLTF